MQINEIFASIDGEGTRTGYLTTFIRSFACNLKCSYCDTLYAVDPQTEEDKKNAFKTMSIDEIVEECDKRGNKRITFTGGEPLIQKDAVELINALTNKGYEVNIETNGAVDLLPFIDTLENQHKVIFTMDWKSPSSLMRERMIKSNLSLLGENDVLKFVVGTQADLQDMLDIVSNNDLECSIFVSPVYGAIEGKDIVKFMYEHNLQNVRVQIQLHKYFWPPQMRGV